MECLYTFVNVLFCCWLLLISKAKLKTIILIIVKKSKMRQLQPCRICTKSTKERNLKNLFEKNQKLVTQIEEITGILLNNIKPLPQHICKYCLEDLEKAHEFRVRCVTSQEYFNSADFSGMKKLPSEDLEIKNEITFNNDPNFGAQDSCCTPENIFTPEIEIKDELPIEEKNIAEFCFVKTESKDVFREYDEPCNIDDSSNSSCTRSNYSAEIHNDALSMNASDDGKDDEKKLNTTRTPKIKRQYRKRIKDEKWHLERQERKLKRAEILKQRQRIKSEKITFICDQCGSSFAYRCNFLAHQRRHTGEKLFHCEICPEKFFLHSELQFHVRKHTGEKPFACEFCDRRFISNSIRMKHQKTHTNERPYVCSQCSKAFTNSYILKNHMLTHTGEKSFRCDMCDKWFGRKTHLVTHYRSMMHKQNEEKLQQNANNLSTENLDYTTNMAGIALMYKNFDEKNVSLDVRKDV